VRVCSCPLCISTVCVYIHIYTFTDGTPPRYPQAAAAEGGNTAGVAAGRDTGGGPARFSNATATQALMTAQVPRAIIVVNEQALVCPTNK